jgi:hypothetical protein
VTTVPAGSRVGKNVPRHLRQSKNIVEFPKNQQTGVRRDLGTMKFQLQRRSKSSLKTPQSASPAGCVMIGASMFE